MHTSFYRLAAALVLATAAASLSGCDRDIVAPVPSKGSPAHSVIPAAAPANDDFDDAEIVTDLPFSHSVTTSGATSAWDDPWCYGQAATVWYEFTPTADGRVEANTAGSDYETALGAYSGSRGDLAELACASGNLQGDYPYQSRVVIDVTAGQPVYFMVGAAWWGSGGNLVFNVDVGPPTPPNDDFDDAIVVTDLPFTHSMDTREATTGWDDPWCGGPESDPATATVWYAFTATQDGRIAANTAGSDYSTAFGAYTGSRGELAELACTTADESFGEFARIVIDVVAGQTVYFMVGSAWGGPGGNLVFNLLEAPELRAELWIDPAGSVDPVTGIATVRGTVTCSTAAEGWINVNLRQRIGRTIAQAGAGGFFPCNGATPWEFEVEGWNAMLVAGSAEVSVSGELWEPIGGSRVVLEQTATVRLRPSS
jgi:hypothetical protein